LQKEGVGTMLVEFSAKNFRSLKKKVTLSMVAGKDAEHSGDLLDTGGKSPLLPVAAIYGANSAGKSNLILAVRAMQDMITGNSAQLLKDKKLPHDPFAFDIGTPAEPTEYEVVYYYNGVKYAYSFAHDAKQILTEELRHCPNGREALIFSRRGDAYTFRENISEQTTLAGRTPGNRLYLVTSNEWNAPQTESAYKWFTERLLPYDEQNTPDTTIDVIRGISDNSIRVRVMEELLLADLGIANVGVTFDPKRQEKPVVLMVHRAKCETGAEQFPLPLERESKGTQRFFSRIGPWILALEKGGILFVDEIESSMHPLLTRRLVEMMQNPKLNPNKAQLVFTTHDAMLLDLSLLRRDQIWFADKDPKSLVTELFSLWDFSARKNENICKGYLQGRYGAIPFLGGEAKWRIE
jgi:predicted ATPase